VDVLEFKNRLIALRDSNLTPLSPEQLRLLTHNHPDLPDEYMALLRTIGHGALMDCTYAIYSGPISPDQVYGKERGSTLAGVKLIGDDFCGYCLGYREGQLGEVTDFGVWQPIVGKAIVDFLAELVFEDVD
jgi:hypothetical protein